MPKEKTKSLKEIRQQILKQRGVEFKKLSKKVIPVTEIPTSYTKTNLMKLLELKHNDTIENLIMKGTIYEVERRLDIDASTVSKWRKLINEAKQQEFFEQFN